MVSRDIQSRIRRRGESPSRPLGVFVSGHNELLPEGVKADIGHGERPAECGTNESEAGSAEHLPSGLDENVQNDLKPEFSPIGSGQEDRFENVCCFLFKDENYPATEIGQITTSLRNSLVALNGNVQAKNPALSAKYKEYTNTVIAPIVDPAEVRLFIPAIRGFMAGFPLGTDIDEILKLMGDFAEAGYFSCSKTQKRVRFAEPLNAPKWAYPVFWTSPSTSYRSIIPVEVFNQSADISDQEREERVIRKLWHAVASAGLPKPESIAEINCSLQKKWQWVETRSRHLETCCHFWQ